MSASPPNKLVPVEPTEAMLEASAIDWTRQCCGYPPEGGHYKFMRSLWAAMLSASPVVPDGREDAWQPIETALRDGTEVDLWGASFGNDPMRVPDCAWLTLNGVDGWHTRGDEGWESLATIVWVPTHWRPLPAPPVSS